MNALYCIVCTNTQVMHFAISTQALSQVERASAGKNAGSSVATRKSSGLSGECHTTLLRRSVATSPYENMESTVINQPPSDSGKVLCDCGILQGSILCLTEKTPRCSSRALRFLVLQHPLDGRSLVEGCSIIGA